MPAATAQARDKKEGNLKLRNTTVRDISEKLRFLGNHFSLTRSAFVNEFANRHDSSSKATREWWDGTKIPREPTLKKLTVYWSSKISGFPHAMWVLEIAEFRAEFLKLIQRQRVLPIELPYDLTMMTDSEMNNLPGHYVSHRASFFNNGKICKEIIQLTRPISGDRSYLEMYMHAASDSDNDQNNSRSDDNIYSGRMYKYGDVYYSFISATHESISRIRMICFPVTSSVNPSKRWGIISAGASVDRLPVASRILISKTRHPTEEIILGVGRFDVEELELTAREKLFLCNNIAKAPATPQDKDFVLTVSTAFAELH